MHFQNFHGKLFFQKVPNVVDMGVLGLVEHDASNRFAFAGREPSQTEGSWSKMTKIPKTPPFLALDLDIVPGTMRKRNARYLNR